MYSALTRKCDLLGSVVFRMHLFPKKVQVQAVQVYNVAGNDDCLSRLQNNESSASWNMFTL